MSANIELPTQQDLVQLAPEKKVDVIEGTMAQIQEHKQGFDEDRRRHRSTPKFAPAGQSTQMVIGATPTSDRQILGTATHLYSHYGLRRIYYSSFSPFPLGDARLPQKAPPLVREHRLYQADWLMRYYQFDASELTSDENPNLSLNQDPKLTWAQKHPEFFPVDVNAAPREALLRVPGIGHRNVDRIVRIRRYHRLSLDDLRKLRVLVKTAGPYVIADGHLPRITFSRLHDHTANALHAPQPFQLDLFPAASTVSGQL